MKKFLAVFDGYKMSESTLQYAIQLTKAANAHLVGVFLDEFIYQNYKLSEVVNTHKDFEKVIAELDKKDAKMRKDSANRFRQTCEKAGILFSIHKNVDIAIQELKNESIYADLIIINESETFSKSDEKAPTRFIKDLLGDVQCPVLVVPDKYKAIEKIVLLYDGAPAAVHALKMFNYVLGNPDDLPVKVFTVKEEKKKEAFYLPDNTLLREFVKGHFPKAAFTVARGSAESEILSYLKSLPKNEMVVLGAYQRSEVSRWFKISMADILMKELSVPLFIAHNK